MTEDREKLEFAIRDAEWATQIQQGLEEYMTRLYESVDASMDDPEFDVETESGQPFCACNVCEGREILSYVVPRAIHGYLNGSVAIYVDDKEIAPASNVVEDSPNETS